MRGSRKFCQMGSNFDNFFFVVDEGREDPSIPISGPSSARQQNAFKVAFCWCADDGSTLNAGWLKKNLKNIGLLSNTDPDPLKNHKAAAFLV